MRKCTRASRRRKGFDHINVKVYPTTSSALADTMTSWRAKIARGSKKFGVRKKKDVAAVFLGSLEL